MALFVAAPLLTAAALSLAGVVGGADTQFRWPGPILLLLVVASLTLIASIQLSYHARLFLYSHGDLVGWLSSEYVDSHKIHLWKKQKEDQQRWQKYNKPTVVCFNAGTVLLGLGIAAALVPPDGGRQAPGAGPRLSSSCSRPWRTASGSPISSCGSPNHPAACCALSAGSHEGADAC